MEHDNYGFREIDEKLNAFELKALAQEEEKRLQKWKEIIPKLKNGKINASSRK